MEKEVVPVAGEQQQEAGPLSTLSTCSPRDCIASDIRMAGSGNPLAADDRATSAVQWPQALVFKPRRFDIRTPPSPDHLSTAECIATVAAMAETSGHHAFHPYATGPDPDAASSSGMVGSGSEIFEALMRPLDLMVHFWHDAKHKRGASRRANTNTDLKPTP
jgi:hypothetical protein